MDKYKKLGISLMLILTFTLISNISLIVWTWYITDINQLVIVLIIATCVTIIDAFMFYYAYKDYKYKEENE